MRWRAAPSPAEIFDQMSIRWTCCAPSMGFPAQATQTIGQQRRGFSWTFSFRAPDLNELHLCSVVLRGRCFAAGCNKVSAFIKTLKRCHSP